MYKVKTVKRQDLYIGKNTLMETDTALYHIKVDSTLKAETSAFGS